jgi:hypothetical protein
MSAMEIYDDEAHETILRIPSLYTSHLPAEYTSVTALLGCSLPPLSQKLIPVSPLGLFTDYPINTDVGQVILNRPIPSDSWLELSKKEIQRVLKLGKRVTSMKDPEYKNTYHPPLSSPYGKRAAAPFWRSRHGRRLSSGLMCRR